ncbi:Putative fatty-acid--CoA ligase fadD21 [Marinibacterium anthonyi]|nr:Putative fatty-acid--CoA ligase fadD21 [Marinibacterium anthonyi]
MHYNDYRNVIDAVQAAARRYSDRRITMYNGRCKPVSSRSYQAFLDAAQAMAGRIAAGGVRPGDRVLICLANSWDWLDSWLGTLWLGALPVAASPGFAMGSAAYREEKTFGIAELLGARMVICGEALRARADSAPEGCRVVTPEELTAAGDLPEPWDAGPNDIAYLQLTSGSTGIPKAAQITHRGMMHNVWAMFDAATRRRGGNAPRSGTTWLPLFHDFGLVMTMGGIMNGVEIAVFPPNAYLSRPQEWLKHLGTMDAPMCGMPNFGLHHAVNRVTEAQMDGMNLSSWHTCFIGAEMTRAETLSAFLGQFAAAGCPAEMLAPSYGMAEATLGVTLDQKAVGLRTGMSEPDSRGERLHVVCCGAPLRETELKIMGPEGELGEGEIGEVYLKAGGVISGYYNNPEATAAAFDGDWLKTGDLGFMRAGEIYLTGRIKEILIVNGANYMPEELENLAEREGGSGGMERAAAFTVATDGQGEQPVVVVEIDRRTAPEVLADLGQRIAGRISRELGMSVREVLFVSRGSIPRTTSGKLQRGDLREAYLAGEITGLPTSA